MFYLIATILFNVFIAILMKLFPKYGINALQAIVTNYIVCVITGSITLGYFPIQPASLHQSWFPWALLMGAGFISIFNLLAYCTKVDGITTATIANKLSLAIPVIFAVLLYQDTMNIGKISGLFLAFPAVYLTTQSKTDNNKKQSLTWPIALFIFSGLLDTLVKYVQVAILPQSSEVEAIFTIHTFAVAAFIGTLICILLIITGKMKLHWRNILAGICLGIPNYFSIYLYIRLLGSGFMQSSAAIPVMNTGVLLLSSLVAILFFSEKLTLKRAFGLTLAVIAILLIALCDKA